MTAISAPGLGVAWFEGEHDPHGSVSFARLANAADFCANNVRHPKAPGRNSFLNLNGNSAPRIVISCLKGTIIFWNEMGNESNP